MQVSRLKSLNLALIFCLLPLGLKAQTTTDVSTAVTTAHTFAASGDILAITATGSIIVSSGVAVTGHADGDNTITNAGEISSTDSVAIILQSLNTVTNSGTITGGTDSSGIHLAGTALAATVTAQATRPAHDASDTLRDAYYFNNKVVNNTGGTITGNGINGNGITISGARAQILNTGGNIVASGTGGYGIYFNIGSGQGFVQNTGSITTASGNAIAAASGVDAITIHNTGTIESTGATAIALQSLNLIVNSGAITSGTESHGIWLGGAALAATVATNADRPAYNAVDATRDAYYFNNKIINEVVGTGVDATTGTITGKGTGHGINIAGARAQILNTGGNIVAEGSGDGISFDTGQSFVQNTGSITATATGYAIASYGDEITIHNDGGTIESTGSDAIILQSLSLIVNSGVITAGTDSDGIYLAGAALQATLDANLTAPAYDTTDAAARDAYYFNNKIINEVVGSNTGTITGTGTGNSITIAGARAQILNAGDIDASGTGHGINFDTGSGQSFIQNTGNITSPLRFAIQTASGVDEIIIHNDGGTIESTENIAIALRSLNLIVNSGAITAGYHGIQLSGAADATMLAANLTAPAYDTTDAAVRDAYYFNNKIINETGGTITGKNTGYGIFVIGARVQILNAGDIVAEDTGHGIGFGTGSGQSFVQNTDSITVASGIGIVAGAGIDEIIIHNTGTIEGTTGSGIFLQSLNLIVNSGTITGGSYGIQLVGTALQATVDTNPTAPAYDSTQTLRDAYYFNNKVINETGGTITGKGVGSGIATISARIQVLNTGDIIAEGTGHGILFATGSGQSFIQNTGSITAASGATIATPVGIDAIIIHNDGGTIESTGSIAVLLESLNLIVNSGAITGELGGIWLAGTALQATVDAQATRPAYNSNQTLRDAYYFNNKVVNNAGGTITGTGAGSGITISGARAQILNTGGDIIADDTGHGIRFAAGSGQGFVQNTGSITSASGNAIHTFNGIDAITIHNDGGTIESTGSHAIVLQSLNLIVNSGDITGGTDSDGIQLAGTADATEVANNPTAPAYDTTDADVRDAYYFNNKIINETGGTITGKNSGYGISITGTRIQIFNAGGGITAEGGGHGISFGTGAGQGFVYNTSTIITASGNAIQANTGIDEIIIHNAGAIESTASTAIVLQSLNLIVNSGDITGGTEGIHLAGIPLAQTITDNPTAPAWDSTETLRDAYYFNNKVVNEVGGTITGKGANHAIHVVGKRVQIFNHGNITAEGTGHGIYFNANSGESIIVNTGNIISIGGWGIYAHATAGGITVVNGGCITGGAGSIRLSGANDTLVLRSGSKVVGTVDFGSGNQDELIYAGTDGDSEIDLPENLEITSESDSDSELGVGDPRLTDGPDDGSGDNPDDGSGGSSSSMGNYATLFRLSDDLALDLNASIKDTLYEHNFGLHSEKNASGSASTEPSFWAQGFGSFRAQDETDDNAKADHILGGILIGYDLPQNQDIGIGFFLGAALGSLDTDDSAELVTQNFFGGFNIKLARDNLFYGFNFAAGFTYHESERSVKESGETVKIKGSHKGYFFSPEFIVGIKTQMNGVNIIPSLQVRYLFAFLEEYTEEDTALDRLSVEERNTATLESRAQLTFPFQPSNQQWSFEPRLGLEYRVDLDKNAFDVETVETETPINYDAEKENTLGIFGGLSVHYLTDNAAFKFSVDTIYNDESLVIRAQAGLGFQF